MDAQEPDQPAADETELGATGGDLPLWRAREAIRHAELRLGVQGAAAQALEGRGTSMLGWSVAGLPSARLSSTERISGPPASQAAVWRRAAACAFLAY